MRDEVGAVLAFVILLMLALLALAHGVLMLSISELGGSRAAARELEVRGAARWALATTLAAPPGGWIDSVGTWEGRRQDLGAIGAIEVSGTVRRLSGEAWLVAGEARNGRGVSARSVRLAWRLDPLERLKPLSAVVSVGPESEVTLAGNVESSSPAAEEAPMQPGACRPWSTELDAHYVVAPLDAVGPLPDSSSTPALGLLGLDELLAAAPIRVAGVGTPAPLEALGTCVTDAPWAWGDPDRPWGPCGSHLPMRGAEGGLVVRGGMGQGMLVVDGDLTFEDGARYYGMLVVGGTLRMRAGSSFEGMALAGGGVSLAVDTRVRGSACWALRALIRARGSGVGYFVPIADMGPWTRLP